MLTIVTADHGLKQHRREWEELADLDPLWAILSDPTRRFGRWDIDEFFATGEHEISAALSWAQSYELPKRHQSALDIGCGVGRLTRALATRFENVHGVDISDRMVDTARVLNAHLNNCTFQVSTDPALADCGDRTVDLVYSALVLQHLPTQATIETYLRSFVRILRPGGVAIFQLPSNVSLRRRLQPRRRAYMFLRWLRVPAGFLYRRLALAPMRLNFVPERRVRAVIEDAGGHVLDAISEQRAGPGVESRTYLVRRRDAIT